MSEGYLENDKVVQEVRFCGYREYDAAIRAADQPLTPKLSATEAKVLALFQEQFNGFVEACWSKALLFGTPAKRLKKTELAALVKLVRRGRITVTRFCTTEPGQAGWRHRYAVS